MDMDRVSSSDRLIVTNGDCAVEAIEQALGGAGHAGWDLLPWRDVLHDGPVPADLDDDALATVRARFIAACGWADEQSTLESLRQRDRRFVAGLGGEAVVLWFEHDLYDQLQLLQLLDRLSRSNATARLTMIVRDAFVAQQDPETLAEHLAARTPITAAQRALGREGWQAVRAATPQNLVALVAASEDRLGALPFLRTALLRLLDEYPGARDGLSRTQQRTLRTVEQGARPVGELFGAVTATEEAAFMGDSSYFQVVSGLVDAATPALAMADGSVFRRPTADLDPKTFRGQVVRLTPFGRDLLDGRADWVASNGIDRWLGGVHLTEGALWRWDRKTQRLATGR